MIRSVMLPNLNIPINVNHRCSKSRLHMSLARTMVKINPRPRTYQKKCGASLSMYSCGPRFSRGAAGSRLLGNGIRCRERPWQNAPAQSVEPCTGSWMSRDGLKSKRTWRTDRGLERERKRGEYDSFINLKNVPQTK